MDDHPPRPGRDLGWGDLRRGYRLAGLVTGAHRLGLLGVLAEAGPATTEAAADACLADPSLVEWLLRGLAGAGIVDDVGERWRLSPAGADLATSAGAATELDALARDYDRFGRLDATARALGAGDGPVVTDDEHAGPGAARRAALREAVRHAGEPDAVLDRLSPRRSAHWPLRVLHVGGGDGGFARRLAERWEEAEVVVLEQPDVAMVAEEACDGLARVSVQAGDYLDGDEPLPGGADVVVLSHVLQGLDTASQRRLVCRATRALAPGGCVISCELVLRADERGPLDVVLWALGESAAGRLKKVLTDHDQETLLRAAGLAAVGAWTVTQGSRAVLGVRPDAGAEPALELIAAKRPAQEPLVGENREANSSLALRSVS